MKKSLLCALFISLLFLAGSHVYAAGEEVAVNERGTLTVGYVRVGSESDWRVACNKSVADAFTAENGYYLLTVDGQQKQERQVKAMREFISQEVDYILLDPITESGWDSALLEAKEAGIPVIVFDREVKVKDADSYACFLGSDFYLEGRRACAYLKAYLEASGYEGELHIAHIQGTEGSSAQIGRTAALDDALLENPSWKLLDRQDGEFTTAKGKEIMVDMLEKYGDEIQVVYCENDNEAFGAIEAIEESGREAGPDLAAGQILVLSFDTTKSGLKLTLSKKIAVNTECAPLYGPLLTQLVQQLEGGGTPERKHFVEEQQFSALGEVTSLEIDGETYEVTPLTEEIVEERSY